MPRDMTAMDRFGPVHTFLTGEHDEKDRQLVIKEAPLTVLSGKKSQSATVSKTATSVPMATPLSRSGKMMYLI